MATTIDGLKAQVADLERRLSNLEHWQIGFGSGASTRAFFDEITDRYDGTPRRGYLPGPNTLSRSSDPEAGPDTGQGASGG